MGSLFGTDGIRGVAGKYPMTVKMVLSVGQALVSYFRRNQSAPHIIIGKDTRISGDMLAHALMAGICSKGGNASMIGVVPTPAVAQATVFQKADAGVMISASHNPYVDNGIKIFNGRGLKLFDDQESIIEDLILAHAEKPSEGPTFEPGIVNTGLNAGDEYISFLHDGRLHKDVSLKNLHVILDCGHGATFDIAPRFFGDLGMRIEALHTSPDGRNINNSCGSQHPEILAQVVVDNTADAGLAFDGDGDRVIAVDEKGRVLSGDVLIAIFARHLKKIGRLAHDTAVSTVMSNIGLGLALKEAGIQHLTTSVGDRYVMQKMLETGAVIGGEDSGHMIFSDHHTTGDGVLTGLHLLEIMAVAHQKLSQLTDIITIFPQTLINVDVRSKPPIEAVPDIKNAIETAETELGNHGRVLVRYSGTQSCCRVMVEGPTPEVTERLCRRVADVIEKRLGKP